jgi:hypothetical protein
MTDAAADEFPELEWRGSRGERSHRGRKWSRAETANVQRQKLATRIVQVVRSTTTMLSSKVGGGVSGNAKGRLPRVPGLHPLTSGSMTFASQTVVLPALDLHTSSTNIDLHHDGES